MSPDCSALLIKLKYFPAKIKKTIKLNFRPRSLIARSHKVCQRQPVQ